MSAPIHQLITTGIMADDLGARFFTCWISGPTFGRRPRRHTALMTDVLTIKKASERLGRSLVGRNSCSLMPSTLTVRGC